MPVFDVASFQGASAPYWFIELFKTLGFALHLLPMGLWLVGLPVSILLWIPGRAASKRLAQRFFQQVPILVAGGVCFGFLPLLFTQFAYPKAFYTSAILLGGHWLAILLALLVGYYASCLAASRARAERIWRTAFYACVATCCYVVVGLIHSSFWVFFERPYEWESVWASSSESLGGLLLGGAGTASGLGVYWYDLSILIRFVSVVGIGFFALATWFVFDAYYLYRGPRKLTPEEQSRLHEAENVEEKEKGKKKRAPLKLIHENSEAYISRATSIAFFLLLPGLLIAAAAIGKYALESSAALQHDENWRPLLWNLLLGGIGASMILPFFFFLLYRLRKLSGRSLAVTMLFCDCSLAGVYATLRQILQNARLRPYFDPASAQTTDSVQWLPILAFLGVLAVVAILIFLIFSTLTTKAEKRTAQKPKKTPKKTKNTSKKSASRKSKTKSANAPPQEDDGNQQPAQNQGKRRKLRRKL